MHPGQVMMLLERERRGFQYSVWTGKEVAGLKATKNTKKKEVIASRKSCKATGTGLSHYVMPDLKKK